MAAPTTRAFLAVDPPDELRASIGRLQDRLKDLVPSVRWTRPEQLHVTLAFLGDVPNDAIDALRRAVLEAAAECPAFEVSVGGLGAFPSIQRPRVVWLGLEGDQVERFSQLHERILQALRAAGHPPADDRFHPHITLGRVRTRSRKPPDLDEAVRVASNRPEGRMPVAQVVTYASVLRPEGPVYQVLDQAPLAGAADR